MIVVKTTSLHSQPILIIIITIIIIIIITIIITISVLILTHLPPSLVNFIHDAVSFGFAEMHSTGHWCCDCGCSADYNMLTVFSKNLHLEKKKER